MPKRGKSSKGKSLNVYNIVKMFIIIAIIVYIIGIVPTFINTISTVFSNPLFKLGCLVVVLSVGYKDFTIGSLLAIAFIVTYLKSETNQLVGGISSGAGQLVGGIGSGAQQLLGGAGQLVGGVSPGAQQALGGVGQLVGGVSSGAQSVIGGVGSGAQSVIGGVGYGAQSVIGGVGSGVQSVIGGVGSGVQSVIGGVGSGVQSLLGNTNDSYENMENSQAMSVSQAYQQHMLQENEHGDKGCSVQPTMMTGCDPIVGYNAPYNCGCNGACGGNCGGLDPACLCTGVSVWKDELNAQGLNFPLGYSGCNVGSTY